MRPESSPHSTPCLSSLEGEEAGVPRCAPRLCERRALLDWHTGTQVTVGHAEGPVEPVRGREEGGPVQPQGEVVLGAMGDFEKAEPGALGKWAE